jgi:hypothetical protein
MTLSNLDATIAAGSRRRLFVWETLFHLGAVALKATPHSLIKRQRPPDDFSTQIGTSSLLLPLKRSGQIDNVLGVDDYYRPR